MRYELKSLPVHTLRGVNINIDQGQAKQREDIQNLAQNWKANHVRIQIFTAGVPVSFGELDKSSLEYFRQKIDPVLKWCKEFNLSVVLDAHGSPGNTSHWTEPKRLLWEDFKWHENFIRLWCEIAEYYKDNKTIVGYELLNEPNMQKQIKNTPSDWNLLAKKLTSAIREVDTYHTIIVGPVQWSNPSGFTSFEPTGDPNTLYTFHMYTPHQFTHQGVWDSTIGIQYPGMINDQKWDKEALINAMKPAIEFQRKNNLPKLYVGEFSSIIWAPDKSSYNYLCDLLDIFETEGWDWVYHAYQEWFGWSLEYEGIDRNNVKYVGNTDRLELFKSYFIKNKNIRLGINITDKQYINSIGMQFSLIDSGSFMMGNDNILPEDLAGGKPHLAKGDFDERPVHQVSISRPFYMGIHEVTNAQYEQFDPEHRKLRGKLGFSSDDNEAVVFVSWHDAVKFCEWLSDKENLPYRLPTEAEWEYACRAGSTTIFHTGDSLPKEFHKNVCRSWFPDPDHRQTNEIIPLVVGQTIPNACGIFDMHGNVEEWCYDWYGSYESDDQIDPIGREDGDFRVTRGGSHSTELYYLRSANRIGTLPGDKSWLIGFRVVIGEMPDTKPLPVEKPSQYQVNVSQSRTAKFDIDMEKPYFNGPRKYVKVPPNSNSPMFSQHNHDPAIVACPNGDLLAIWYSCFEESGRELTQLASRLRYGEEEWEDASIFWDAPDHNDHAPALWFDGKDTIYHFSGLSAAATWGNTATIMRTSNDNGATWSKARLINPEHRTRQMPVESVFRTKEGYIILPCDAVTGGQGGTAIHISKDDGLTWYDPGGKTAGIHAGIVQLNDGRLMALGRGDNIDGKMPKSISSDMGKTWTYSASPFQPITSGQRLVLLRLKEGAIFFASFAKEMMIADSSGKQRSVSGLFSASSFDEGETWSNIKLITDDKPDHEVEAMDGRLFIMNSSNAEPAGYMSVCQSADGIIHLISSRQHYAFNLAWLKIAPSGVE